MTSSDNQLGSQQTRTVAVALAVLVIVVVAGPLVGLYTDLLWFAELGQRDVLVTRVLWRLGTGAAFGVAAALFAWANVAVARRLAPKRLAAVPLVEDWYRPLDNWLREARERLEPVVSWVLAGAVVLVGLLGGISGSGAWSLVLRYLARGPFGVPDPLFKQDAGVYVFELPLWLFAQKWLLGIIAVTAVLTVAVHLLDGAIRFRAVGDRFAAHVKAHISVLLALLALVAAWGYWLDRWLLLFSPRGQVTGASYTDINAQLPAYGVLVGVSLAVAALLFANIRNRGWRLPAVGVGAWVLAAVVLGGAWPAVIQQLRVSPNELEAEMPYIAKNIQATRAGFAIQGVKSSDFAASKTLSSAALAEETPTVSNIRLWDPETVDQTFAQLQEIRLYYDFADVDVDRYVVGGQRRVVMLSARELDVDQLPDRAQTWVNQHLVYTHGYGVVMSPASRATGDGLPDFLVSNIPPESRDPALAVKQPAVYYGEIGGGEDRYVVVGTTVKEFDYPKGAANQYTAYAGSGGIRLSSTLRRAAFAWRFSDLRLLVSPAVTTNSRILIRRAIVDRVERLAPFLMLDHDPYAVLVDGRIKWVQDAYTTSEYYPYSERYQYGDRLFNYVRNSVKIVTDAYDGTVTMYVVDDKDPVIGAWRRIFPTLFTDGAEAPAALKSHFRYPELYFLIQADVLRAYHMDDIGAFYAKEDLWAIPRDTSGERGGGDARGDRPMAPYYVLMRLPGEKDERFILMLPFTPNGKNNMVAWLAATGDPDDYGRLEVFSMPKQRLVFGPEQIDAKVNQDPQISAQLTLWNQQGSKVVRGNMLVIPVRESIVYVQPIYLRAAQSQFPQLEKVIVSFGERLVMEDDLRTALAAAFELDDTEALGGTGESGEATRGAEQPPGAGAEPSVATLIDEANRRFAAAEAAQQRGDWAAYGREIAALKRTLARLAEQSSAGAP